MNAVFEQPSAPAARAPRAPRAAGGLRVPERLLPLLGIGTALLVWELLVRSGVLDRRYLPSLLDIGAATARLLTGAFFWGELAKTFGAAAGGFVIGCGVAVPAGLIAGASAPAYRALRIPVEFLRPLPSVALIPLVVLLWGPTAASKIFVVAFTTVWPVFIQSAYGVQDCNRTAIDTGRAFGLDAGQRLLRIILPSAVPFIATALRVQASIAVLVAITAELALGGGGGVGNALFQFQNAFDYPSIYALIVVIGLLGMALASALAWAERRFLSWHPSHRAEAAE